MTSEVRMDLYALKLFADDGKQGDWCITLISRTLQTAHNQRKVLRADTRREYPLVDPKIIHPTQDEVDAYVLCGNAVVI